MKGHRFGPRLAWAILPMLFAGVVTTAVLLLVLGNSLFPEAPGQPGQPGITITQSAGYLILPPSGEAARRADLVVIAEVMEPLDVYWNTADGERPDVNDRGEVLNPQARIFTEHVLRVNEALKGTSPPGGQVVLTRLGGQIGSDRVVLEDDHPLSLEQGDTVLAFLRDCGPERAEAMGSEGFRHVLISRYVVEDGHATAISVPVPMDEMRETIENNKSLEPRAETSC